MVAYWKKKKKRKVWIHTEREERHTQVHACMHVCVCVYSRRCARIRVPSPLDSTRLGRVTLSDGPVCGCEKQAYGGMRAVGLVYKGGSSYPTADARPPPPTQIRLCRSAPNGRDGSERKEGEKRTVALASCVYKMACIPTFAWCMH